MIFAVVACAYPFLGKIRRVSRVYRRQWQLYCGKKAPSGFRHILTFAYTLADRLAFRAGYFDTRRIRILSPEHYASLNKLYQSGGGMFCITSHLGCFDMLRVMFDCTQKGMKGEIHVFMDKLATLAFSRMQQQFGSRHLESFVHDVQQLSPALSMMMAEKVENGAMMVMTGDRVWRDDASANYEQKFLGRSAQFPRGCFRWAAALSCPVYSFALLENKGYYDLHIDCLSFNGSEKAEVLLERFVENLQQLCRDYSVNWFNFYNFWK